jgi:hypothetical protein
VSDEFWTPEEDAEFAQAELDDAAASQAAEDQFPTGWTDVGVTTEPIQLGRSIVIGPAELYTQPVTSPIFEAIDRASQDRTPVVESTTDIGSFARILESLTESLTSFTKTVQGAAKTASSAGDKLDALEQIYGPLTHHRRQVALIGTGKRRHRATRGTRTELGLNRAEHARRRRLYSERLRRDRRRIRKGRAPILRSSTFEAVIPNAQINVTKAGPEYWGMEIVAAPWVPEDQAYIIDPSTLDGYRFTEPKDLDVDLATWRASWRGRLMSTLGLYSGLTGRTHRVTNFLIQADTGRRRGYRPSRVWVDNVEVDVDRWLDDGGA